ncbi:MAG TPA: hypothetical protein PLR64_00555 [Candidatus Dojkabacteria bacterium]|nr:hypothetical protein [Candidatus Dojkabacteria bacterium]
MFATFLYWLLLIIGLAGLGLIILYVIVLEREQKERSRNGDNRTGKLICYSFIAGVSFFMFILIMMLALNGLLTL